MATMNVLSANGGPWEGRYMIQKKRITVLVICSKLVVRFIAFAARCE